MVRDLISLKYGANAMSSNVNATMEEAKEPRKGKGLSKTPQKGDNAAALFQASTQLQ